MLEKIFRLLGGDVGALDPSQAQAMPQQQNGLDDMMARQRAFEMMQAQQRAYQAQREGERSMYGVDPQQVMQLLAGQR